MENKHIYSCCLCYAFFSFAVYIPAESMSIYEWLTFISINAAIYLLVGLLSVTEYHLKPFAKYIVIAYLPLLAVRQIILFSDYIRLYHRQSKNVQIIILSVLFILMLLTIPLNRSGILSYTFISAVMVLLIIVLIVNINKFNPGHLYNIEKNITGVYDGTVLFDFIVPLQILLMNKKHNRYNIVALFTGIFIFCTIITVFSFGCIKGNLLYSLSPLQILFNISNTNIISNFDGFFNILLSFSFFSSLFIIISAYRFISDNSGRSIALKVLIPVLLFRFLSDIGQPVWLFLQIFIAFMIIICRKKEKQL